MTLSRGPSSQSVPKNKWSPIKVAVTPAINMPINMAVMVAIYVPGIARNHPGQLRW